MPTATVTKCVIWGTLPNLSKVQFILLEVRDKDTIWLTVLKD
jgi:hypothetical protein